MLWPASCVWACNQGEYSAVARILCLGLDLISGPAVKESIVLWPGSCVWPAKCCGLDLVSGPAVKENIVLWPGSQCEPGIGLCFVRPVAQ